MLNPFLKVEWLKEGRNVRLPMIIIFYNAILAFITILFMFFNAESLQEGYSYNTSSYLYQFLIISTFQIGMIFVLCDRQRKAYVRRIRYDTRFFQTICNRKSFCNYCHIYDAFCIKPSDYFSVLHLQWLTMAKNPTPWNHDADLYFLECINFCFFIQLLQERNLGICTEYSNRSNVCFRNSFSNGNNTVIFDFSNRSRKSCTDRYQFMYAF